MTWSFWRWLLRVGMLWLRGPGTLSRPASRVRVSNHDAHQVTSYPETEQEASADTPLIAPQGAQQQQQQQFMQMQLASGNQVRERAALVQSFAC